MRDIAISLFNHLDDVFRAQFLPGRVELLLDVRRGQCLRGFQVQVAHRASIGHQHDRLHACRDVRPCRKGYFSGRFDGDVKRATQDCRLLEPDLARDALVGDLKLPECSAYLAVHLGAASGRGERTCCQHHHVVLFLARGHADDGCDLFVKDSPPVDRRRILAERTDEHDVRRCNGCKQQMQPRWSLHRNETCRADIGKGDGCTGAGELYFGSRNRFGWRHGAALGGRCFERHQAEACDSNLAKQTHVPNMDRSARLRDRIPLTRVAHIRVSRHTDRRPWHARHHDPDGCLP